MFNSIPAEVIGWAGVLLCLVVIGIGIRELIISFMEDNEL
jgi:hypothetical protein